MALIKCVRYAGSVYGTKTGGALALGMRLTVPYVRNAVDAFIPISETVRKGCEVDELERCRVIPNFIGDLPPSPETNDSRLDGLPSEPFIVFFGDATVDKGAAHLAHVYRTLKAPPPLVFIGRCFVDELRETPGIVVMGPQPHAIAIEAVRRSLFVVTPSLWAEPFGLVALETSAAGVPIVASDIGGLRDIVVDGETGLLVAPGDEADLRRAIQTLLADPELRRSLGAKARERARTFSPDKVVPQFEAMYRRSIDLVAARER